MPRRSKIRKQSKQPVSKLDRKLKELCKQIIRKTYPNECYTCNQKNLKGSNYQTGHMIPKGALGAFLRWDLRILRPQCFNCNLNLGGNGAEFIKRMIIREGQEYVDQIYRDRQVIVKAYDHYLMLIEKYKLILEESAHFNKES
jgi:hypothetical protein